MMTRKDYESDLIAGANVQRRIVLSGLRKLIMVVYGERCPDYEASCIACQIWEIFDLLNDKLLDEELFSDKYLRAEDAAAICDHFQGDKTHSEIVKTTSSKAAAAASKVLKDPKASKAAKSAAAAAASVLTQVKKR